MPGMGAGAGSDGAGSDGADSHWVRWHAAYEDPSSNLSLRLRAVQSMVRAALDEIPARAGPGRGRGRPPIRNRFGS
jgi:hypothetical protein